MINGNRNKKTFKQEIRYTNHELEGNKMKGKENIRETVSKRLRVRHMHIKHVSSNSNLFLLISKVQGSCFLILKKK